ncbi:hypothetical protein N9F18_00250 [bacterium]|nr:hypothetical protein [bacterium]
MKNLIRRILKEEVNKKDLTVIFGGILYATPNWMKEQWIGSGLSTDNVKFLKHTSNELTELKNQYNVNKIMGFSAGGLKIWDEIKNNPNQYDFIGLIDPSTPTSTTTLPNNVKMVSRYQNWAYCCGGPQSDNPRKNSYYSNLKEMEELGLSKHTDTKHKFIPKEFFMEYANELIG